MYNILKLNSRASYATTQFCAFELLFFFFFYLVRYFIDGIHFPKVERKIRKKKNKKKNLVISGNSGGHN